MKKPCGICSCRDYHRDINAPLDETCICGHGKIHHRRYEPGNGGAQKQPDGSYKIPLGATGYPGSGHKSRHCQAWCKRKGYTYIAYLPAPGGDKPPWGYCHFRK